MVKAEYIYREHYIIVQFSIYQFLVLMCCYYNLFVFYAVFRTLQKFAQEAVQGGSGSAASNGSQATSGSASMVILKPQIK